MMYTYLIWRGRGWAWNEQTRSNMVKGERVYVAYEIKPDGIHLSKPFERVYRNAAQFDKEWERA